MIRTVTFILHFDDNIPKMFTSMQAKSKLNVLQTIDSCDKLSFFNQNYELRKYRILEFINAKPHYESIEIRRKLPKLLGIPRQRFSRWLNLPIEDTREIPYSHLVRIASFLDVEPSELINFNIAQLQPFEITRSSKRNLSASLGLVSSQDH